MLRHPKRVTLLKVLSDSKGFECGDKKDSIYLVCDLARDVSLTSGDTSEGGSHVDENLEGAMCDLIVQMLTIRPDYDKSTTPEEVFRQAAMEFLQKERFGNPLVYFYLG